jgi:hypothetical protein
MGRIADETGVPLIRWPQSELPKEAAVLVEASP